MRKRICKTITYMLSAIMILMLFPVVSFAAEVPDPARLGSIKLVMADSVTSAPITDGTLEVFQVAKIVVSGSIWNYELMPAYVASGISLGTLGDPALAAQFEAFADGAGLAGTLASPDSTGTVICTDLQIGVYLVRQKTPATGYLPIASFLATIPIDDNGTLVYDINAAPKCGSSSMIVYVPAAIPGPPVPTSTPDINVPPPTVTPTPEVQVGPPRIPQTGQLNWPIPLLTISGLILLTLGWYLIRTDEGEANE